MLRLLCLSQCQSCWDFHYSAIIRHPGERATRPREGISTPPPRRIGHRRPFFRRVVIGWLCGMGVAPHRGRGRSSGARDSQLFFGSVITTVFSKIQMTTTTSKAYYITRIMVDDVECRKPILPQQQKHLTFRDKAYGSGRSRGSGQG